MNNQAERDRVVAAGLSWLNTPFHDVAGIKGVGVDCAHFVARVYEEAGIIPHIEIAPYPAQWFMHRSRELFLEYVIAAGAREIAPELAQRGDLIMFKIGRCYAHAAIIVDWPEIVHAHSLSRAVVLGDALGGDIGESPRRFFSMWREDEG